MLRDRPPARGLPIADYEVTRRDGAAPHPPDLHRGRRLRPRHMAVPGRRRVDPHGIPADHTLPMDERFRATLGAQHDGPGSPRVIDRPLPGSAPPSRPAAQWRATGVVPPGDASAARRPPSRGAPPTYPVSVYRPRVLSRFNSRSRWILASVRNRFPIFCRNAFLLLGWYSSLTRWAAAPSRSLARFTGDSR